MVTAVVDGDTVDVEWVDTGEAARVRVLGIDTPEVYGGVECWGSKASKAMKALLPVDTIVTLTADSSQDDIDVYDRLLRYISKDAVDAGKRLVRRGHAKVYVYDDNPFERVTAYRAAQKKAKQADLGLWGSC